MFFFSLTSQISSIKQSVKRKNEMGTLLSFSSRTKHVCINSETMYPDLFFVYEIRVCLTPTSRHLHGYTQVIIFRVFGKSKNQIKSNCFGLISPKSSHQIAENEDTPTEFCEIIFFLRSPIIALSCCSYVNYSIVVN